MGDRGAMQRSVLAETRQLRLAAGKGRARKNHDGQDGEERKKANLPYKATRGQGDTDKKRRGKEKQAIPRKKDGHWTECRRMPGDMVNDQISTRARNQADGGKTPIGMSDKKASQREVQESEDSYEILSLGPIPGKREQQEDFSTTEGE